MLALLGELADPLQGGRGSAGRGSAGRGSAGRGERELVVFFLGDRLGLGRPQRRDVTMGWRRHTWAPRRYLSLSSWSAGNDQMSRPHSVLAAAASRSAVPAADLHYEVRPAQG
jgi:hypothetical protein